MAEPRYYALRATTTILGQTFQRADPIPDRLIVRLEREQVELWEKHGVIGKEGSKRVRSLLGSQKSRRK